MEVSVPLKSCDCLLNLMIAAKTLDILDFVLELYRNERLSLSSNCTP